MDVDGIYKEEVVISHGYVSLPEGLYSTSYLYVQTIYMFYTKLHLGSQMFLFVLRCNTAALTWATSCNTPVFKLLRRCRGNTHSRETRKNSAKVVESDIP